MMRSFQVSVVPELSSRRNTCSMWSTPMQAARSWSAWTRRGSEQAAMLAVPRSEERRVGKECRSLCDWSSDVCSSDLAPEHVLDVVDAHAGGEILERLDPSRIGAGGDACRSEIGRASCRERV